MEHETDVILRRRLRDQEHISARTGGGRKDFGQHIRDAHYSPPTKAYQSNIANGGDRLRAGGSRIAGGSDFCAGLLGRKAVTDPDWNACLGDRPQRLWMKYFSAEIGELGCFVIGDLVQDARLADKPRIRREYTIHIGPDDDLTSIEGSAQNGGRIIRTAAPKGG